MIPRYSRPEMTSIWSEQSKFQIWFEIEAHACDAMAELGMIPKDAARAVWERGGFDIDRINEIERETSMTSSPSLPALPNMSARKHVSSTRA